LSKSIKRNEKPLPPPFKCLKKSIKQAFAPAFSAALVLIFFSAGSLMAQNPNQGNSIWNITGNTNINNRNFIGTINPADLNFRTANDHRMVITKDGKFGFGLPVPAEKFHFKGNALFDGNARLKEDLFLDKLIEEEPENKILYVDSAGKVRAIKPRDLPDFLDKKDPCGNPLLEPYLVLNWKPEPGKITLRCPGYKVGIGTTNPEAILDVRGDVQFSGPRLFVGSNGRVGIGTAGPQYKLDVNGPVNATDFLVNGVSIVNSTGGVGSTSGQWTVSGNDISYTTGNVGIGKSNPTNYKLEVCGTIKASQVRVNATGCDFVFEENYTLPSLAERKAFIEKNKHLPYIKPAKDMQENGMDLTEAAEGLLQNLEEMTLHQIRQENLILALMKRIEELEKQLIKGTPNNEED
jgi:hypothetical protein